jgi:hypothetical protein
MSRAFSSFSGAPWGQAAASAQYGNLTVGVSLGSGYQHYFAALSSDEQNTEIAKMKAAGISWVRMDVDWSDAQRTATSAFTFDAAQQTAGPMLAGGINLMMILLWSPTWAQAVGNNPAVPDDPYATISPADFAAFAGAAASHFGPLGVSVFEIWNEPNLDRFTPQGTNSSNEALGLGCFSPQGYAALASAAYTAIHQQYVAKPGGSPTPTVVGGVLSAEARLDYSPSPRSGASWAAVSAGAANATVTCSSAKSTDQYSLISGNAVSVSTQSTNTGGLWPAGTYVSQVTSTGYVLSPPPWLTKFPEAINASSSTSTFGMGSGYPPDIFLTQMYAQAAGAPMFDALSFHPYAWPSLGSFRYLDSGSWAMVPSLRQIMVDNGDGAKAIWFSELGAPTGQNWASWGAAASTATQLVVSSSAAKSEDLGYLVGAASPALPAGSYVASVSAGESWTVMPPTGLQVVETLTGGENVSTLTLSTTTAVTIPDGAKLVIWLGDTNGYSGAPINGYAQAPFLTVTATAQTQIAAKSTGSVPIAQVTVPTIPAGYAFDQNLASIQCSQSLGQTWGAAVTAATKAVANLVPPGVLTTWAVVAPSQQPEAISSEAQQALLIAYAFQFVVSEPWPYVGPMFVYCWSDASSENNAGPYGLTRVDGTPKPAYAALSAVAATGGRSYGLGVPGFVD